MPLLTKEKIMVETPEINREQSNGALTKRCTKCHLWLPFDHFYADSLRPDGLQYWCISCRRMYNKKQPPGSWRRQNLRRFGITPQQYDRMLANQNGVCAVCHRPETCRNNWSKNGEIRPLHVDHDHKTGEIRALLCNHCNTTLGSMNEDPERIRALAEYAEWCQNREPSPKKVQLQLLE
jgi:hypothetical protein